MPSEGSPQQFSSAQIPNLSGIFEGIPQGNTFRSNGEIYEEQCILGRGESSEVSLGIRRDGPSEQLVIKRPLTVEAGELLEREWATLQQLVHLELASSPYFNQLLPSPRRRLLLQDSNGETTAYAYSYQSGFFQTAEDVCLQYPRGVDPAQAVWIWRRVLELLMFLHKAGFVHGALLPAHLLIHARDHGVLVIGWSMAQRRGQSPLRAMVERYANLYPAELLTGSNVATGHALVMVARCIAPLLAGGERMTIPASVPQPLQTLLRSSIGEAGHLPSDDATQFHHLVGEAARQSFGAPRYHHFPMPGWKTPASF